jgi:Heparinase II/III-like protein
MPELSPSFDLTAAQIHELLDPTAPLFPELDAVRSNLGAFKKSRPARLSLAACKPGRTTGAIPQTRYTDYRLFLRTGDRERYETPYFGKRSMLAEAALHFWLGQDDLKDVVQDCIWNVCEETNWVLPAHEIRQIDLFSAETGLELAETINLLGEKLDVEVRHRVRQEIERRVFDPYMRFHELEWWYMGRNNWNGVCNSSIAMTFLLLEPEMARTARAVEIALAGLKVFLTVAFEEDGASTEGPGYWGYGLLNFVPFSEMLRARSHGKIDLLQGEHMRRVAAYPAKLRLSGTMYASFSDAHDHIVYNPGILARLAERTGEVSLLGQITSLHEEERHWRAGIILRNMLWWDGEQAASTAVEDAYLPVGGVARLTTSTAAGEQVVVAIKAGHNDENHNQNDIGSFIVHAGGETLLCDPGAGLYTRQYFGPERYSNVFANSYGHSVPRIGGVLQAAGRQYEGKFLSMDMKGKVKKAELEIGRAYPLPNVHVTRTLAVEPKGGVTLSDNFQFSDKPLEVEEALMTWLPVEVQGATAIVRGEKRTLRLSIEQPAGAAFAVEELTEASAANQSPLLRRITFKAPAAAKMTATIKMIVE